MIARLDLAPDHLTLTLDRAQLPEPLATPPASALTRTLPLQLKRRGQELKLLLTDRPTPTPDPVLQRNLAKATAWADPLREGRSIAELAAANDISPRRIQTLLPLAFLAPDLQRAIAEGTQPTGLTSEWIKRHKLPLSWTEQRRVMASL